MPEPWEKMKHSSPSRYPVPSDPGHRAFTLLELLAVIALITLLIAIALPGLRRAKVVTLRTVCKSNLKQQGVAWHTYLEGNDGLFLQEDNANLDFAGWRGSGYYRLSRPLNPYLDLPKKLRTDPGKCAVRDPGDIGGMVNTPDRRVWDFVGNSYAANIFLIGAPYLKQDMRCPQVFNQINRRRPGLKESSITTTPSLLLLAGDANWPQQWEPSDPEGVAWHGENRKFNMVFMDGHVEWLLIEKDIYGIPGLYTVIPFWNLNSLAMKLLAGQAGK
jgi:prepilin-type N-terminal cleavage/methylation domain-containing protein/prepilin-type processing-associated H-X9-DG protein